MKGKHKGKALFLPQDFINHALETGKHIASIPKNIIICYSKSLASKIAKSKSAKPIIFFGRKNNLFRIKNNILKLVGFEVCVPAIAAFAEELITSSAKNFINIGTAGTLQDLQAGDFVVCDRAIRDEGLSHHYFKSGKYCYASKKLTTKLEKAMKTLNIKYRKGTTWTIDAPYRETIEEVRQYKKEGVLTVEMEASAVFSVAKYRGANAAALFVISDRLSKSKWTPEFHKIAKSKLKLLNIAIKTLSG